MKAKQIIFKALLFFFFSFMLYLSISLIYKKLSNNYLDQHETIDIIELPYNNLIENSITMPYSGNLWVRLKVLNVDTPHKQENIRLKCNNKFKQLETQNSQNLNSEEFNLKYKEKIRIDSKRRQCREEIRFGNITTTLHNEDSEELAKINFPGFNMSMSDISIAAFSDLTIGEKYLIKIITKKTLLNENIKPQPYEIHFVTIPRKNSRTTH